MFFNTALIIALTNLIPAQGAGPTVQGVGKKSGCCELAHAEGAFLNKSIPAGSYVCGQSVKDTLLLALNLAVLYSYCKVKCGGWTQATASNPSNWASTLLQFIVLAVIFSMMIPRGYQLEVLIWIRDIKGKRWKRICNALLLVLGDLLSIE
jgi:hypothetical protein